MNGRSIRLAIQSHRRLIRETLAAYLASRPGFTVVGQTASLDSLSALCALRRPEVALVDSDRLTTETIESLRQLRLSCPGTDAVVAYTDPCPDVMDAARNAGITALVPCSQGLDAVVRMLRQRANGAVRPHANGTALTEREMEIISLMGSGYGVPEMAHLLEISRRTVENHKRRIYTKLRVGNQSHAVSRATVLGLLDAPVVEVTQRPSPDLTRPSLVVVRGPAGICRDAVILALVSARQPFVIADSSNPTDDETWTRWHRGPVTAVLVDPPPEDWLLSTTLGAPTVVVHSVEPDLAAVVDALLRGARALIRAEDVRNDLAAVLSLISRGYVALSATHIGDLADWLGDRSFGSPDTAQPELTARERDILGSIASGHTIRQTARALGIACKTVENTQARLFRKLGAHNRSGALRMAYRLGLVDPSVTGTPQPLHP
jgi:two-component system nitrate/nitrite response regulator NarL